MVYDAKLFDARYFTVSLKAAEEISGDPLIREIDEKIAKLRKEISDHYLGETIRDATPLVIQWLSKKEGDALRNRAIFEYLTEKLLGTDLRPGAVKKEEMDALIANYLANPPLDETSKKVLENETFQAGFHELACFGDALNSSSVGKFCFDKVVELLPKIRDAAGGVLKNKASQLFQSKDKIPESVDFFPVNTEIPDIFDTVTNDWLTEAHRLPYDGRQIVNRATGESKIGRGNLLIPAPDATLHSLFYVFSAAKSLGELVGKQENIRVIAWKDPEGGKTQERFATGNSIRKNHLFIASQVIKEKKISQKSAERIYELVKKEGIKKILEVSREAELVYQLIVSMIRKEFNLEIENAYQSVVFASIDEKFLEGYYDKTESQIRLLLASHLLKEQKVSPDVAMKVKQLIAIRGVDAETAKILLKYQSILSKLFEGDKGNLKKEVLDSIIPQILQEEGVPLIIAKEVFQLVDSLNVDETGFIIIDEIAFVYREICSRVVYETEISGKLLAEIYQLFSGQAIRGAAATLLEFDMLLQDPLLRQEISKRMFNKRAIEPSLESVKRDEKGRLLNVIQMEEKALEIQSKLIEQVKDAYGKFFIGQAKSFLQGKESDVDERAMAVIGAALKEWVELILKR